ncbi:hypothetical protein ABIE13_000225 [Ottowia thiooxydans]|uniref:Transposase n=1 Tax=Ottowia thiooxydans TaxID=219182 RepID=A0ABV2Q3G5_9BURK
MLAVRIEEWVDGQHPLMARGQKKKQGLILRVNAEMNAHYYLGIHSYQSPRRVILSHYQTVT